MDAPCEELPARLARTAIGRAVSPIPAALVSFALRSCAASAAHEPSRFRQRAPGSVPARAASNENRHLPVGPDRPVW